MSSTNNTTKQVTIRDEKGRFIKGVSGNKNGRPKIGDTITDVIRAMMNKDTRLKSQLAETLLTLAIEQQDLAAIKLLMSYLDGNPAQPINGKLEVEAKPSIGGNAQKYRT